MTREAALSRLASTMGGKAAEEMVFGDGECDQWRV